MVLRREPRTFRTGAVPGPAFWMVGLCLLTASGCMVGPNFQPPKASVPPGWTGTTTAPATAPASQPATGAAPADLARWWTTFDDPTLNSLVDRAIQSNLDLRQAEARLLQARAARGVAFSALRPTLNANASFLRSRTGSVTPAGPVASTGNLWQFGLDAAWEIDAFGGLRRNLESADAGIQAAIEDRRDTLVTLLGEVALDYIQLRGFQQQIVIAQDNLKAQRHTAELTRQRKLGGFVSALDVANADALVATTASTIPVLEASAGQAIYSLSVLLAKEPAALVKELTPPSRIPATVPAIPLGLPSDLLRRRPDIRRAEAQLHAATAQIGVATADLFPKFNLAGSGAFQANKIGSLTDFASRMWAINPSASWTLLDAGGIRSNIDLQTAIMQQALLTYQQTVLTALQDVENALIAYAKEQEHYKVLAEAVAANRKAVQLATTLYVQGLTDFLSVLDSQRSLFASEDAQVQSARNLSTDLVALYKALGGGWDEKPQADASGGNRSRPDAVGASAGGIQK